MGKAGFDNGQILEINQVVAYFAYADRTVLGLGVSTEGTFLDFPPANPDDCRTGEAYQPETVMLAMHRSQTSPVALFDDQSWFVGAIGVRDVLPAVLRR